MSLQVLSVANAAAHGLAAGVMMAIGAALGARRRAAASAVSTGGGATLQPWSVDSQLAAVLPGVGTLAEAQVLCTVMAAPTTSEAYNAAPAL